MIGLTLADGFNTEDTDKLYQIYCQFLGKENYNTGNYKHKIEKVYFMSIHI